MSGYYGAFETKLGNIGDQSGMINVGMTENEVIDVPGTKTQVAIHSISVHAFALVHTAIEQYFFSIIKRYQVFAACHFAGCPKNLNIHNGTFLCWYTNISILLPYLLKT
jgi:hypothetical protein